MRVRLIAMLVLLAGTRVATAVDVTECGQVVAPGQVAELKNDLACAAGSTEFLSARGVRLQPGARLRMNGFHISGDGTGAGVECAGGRCTIEGPGEIRGFFAGVNCGGCRVVVRDVVVRGNEEGIYIPLHGTLVADGVVASDNARSGIWAQTIRGTDLEASRNGRNGVSANAWLRIRRLEATANGQAGFLAGSTRSRLVDSAVTDNDVARGGFDVVATGSVRLVRTRCGKSAKIRYWSQEAYDVVGSFGCTND
jgi:hypothetical protein